MPFWIKAFVSRIFFQKVILYTVHSTRIPHFPQNSEENLSFARKPTEDIIYVIHKIPRSSAELIIFLGGTLER